MSRRERKRSRPEEPQVAPHVVQNIEAILALQTQAEERVGKQQRLIERITWFLGRPRTIYSILVLAIAWAAANELAASFGMPVLDPPPFFWMQCALALSALLMTTMVLTTQNRQGQRSEQRAHLDLQVNLLAEQKIAKLISLVEELRRDLPMVHNRRDSLAEAMTHAVDPQAVFSALEGKVEGEAASESPEPAKPGRGS